MKSRMKEGRRNLHGPSKYKKKRDYCNTLYHQCDEENTVDQPDGSGGGIDSEAAGEENPLPDPDFVAEQDHSRARRRHDAEAPELDEQKNHPLGDKGQIFSRIDDDESRNAYGRCAREEGVKEGQRNARTGVGGP